MKGRRGEGEKGRDAGCGNSLCPPVKYGCL